MFVCGAWWFYWECGAVFDRAFGGGDCERISCEDILHQSPGVVYFGDRERIGAAGSWNLVLFLQIGVCGGFTTFSTFSSEALKLFAGGRQGVALSYMVLSVVLGLVCCYGGWLVARMR